MIAMKHQKEEEAGGIQKTADNTLHLMIPFVYDVYMNVAEESQSQSILHLTLELYPVH